MSKQSADYIASKLKRCCFFLKRSPVIEWLEPLGYEAVRQKVVGRS